MSYGTDAAASLLSKAYPYLDTRDMQSSDHTVETLTSQ